MRTLKTLSLVAILLISACAKDHSKPQMTLSSNDQTSTGLLATNQTATTTLASSIFFQGTVTSVQHYGSWCDNYRVGVQGTGAFAGISHFFDECAGTDFKNMTLADLRIGKDVSFQPNPQDGGTSSFLNTYFFGYSMTPVAPVHGNIIVRLPYPECHVQQNSATSFQLVCSQNIVNFCVAAGGNQATDVFINYGPYKNENQPILVNSFYENVGLDFYYYGASLSLRCL